MVTSYVRGSGYMYHPDVHFPPCEYSSKAYTWYLTVVFDCGIAVRLRICIPAQKRAPTCRAYL